MGLDLRDPAALHGCRSIGAKVGHGRNRDTHKEAVQGPDPDRPCRTNDLLTSGKGFSASLKLDRIGREAQELGMLPRGDGECGHPELRLSQSVQHQLLQTRRSVSTGQRLEHTGKAPQ